MSAPQPAAEAGAGAQVASQPASTFVRRWAGLVCGDVAHLLLLTMLVVLVHAWGWLDDTEGYYRRHAVTTYAGWGMNDAVMAPPRPEERSVQLLEVSAALRARSLESDAAAGDRALRRLGGIRPIDRCNFADLLQQLADRRFQLAGPPPDPRRVVAIDVDVTPLDKADAQRCGAKMAKALEALRKTATVIAITTARDDADETQARNEFMQETCKARASLGPLYYASPAVFHDRHGYPLDFPYRAWRAGPGDGATQPPVFPSLGNLMRLAGWPLVADAQETRAAQLSLDALCTLSQPGALPSPGSEPLESLLGASAAVTCEREGTEQQKCEPSLLSSFDTVAYNWRWLHPDRLLTTPIVRDDAFRCTELDCIGEATLISQVLMISIDGGDQQDKFDVPQLAGDPVSGATMHALQALSSAVGGELKLHSGRAVLVDLFVGLLFLVLWKGMAAWIMMWHSLPSLAFIARLVVPAAIAFALYWAALKWISPTLLGHNIWANPAYLLLGLVAHAYTEATHGIGHPQPEPPDFSFGLCRLWKARDPHVSPQDKLDACASAAVQILIVVGGLVVLYMHHALDLRVLALAVVLAGFVIWSQVRKEQQPCAAAV